MDAGNKKVLSPNPRDSANVVSLLTFWWVRDIFKKGYKKDLEVEDLYEALDEHKSNNIGNKMERLWKDELKRASAKGEKASLFRVLVRCHGRYFIFLQLLLAVTELGFVMTQPLLMGRLIRYFSPESNMSRNIAFLYAGCLIGVTTVGVVLSHVCGMAVTHMGMKIRVALCSIIYRKALRLSRSALSEATVGLAVNLMSNDVSRFDVLLFYLGYISVGPLETLIMGYLMWEQIGFAAVFGVAAVLIVIPLQVFVGKLISILRLRTAKRTDQRIVLINEIIVGIQVIKMYAWEKPFARLVSLARKNEIQALRSGVYVQGLMMSFARLMGGSIALFISIVAYVLLGNDITPEKVFVTMGYFNILSITMAVFVTFGVRYLAQAIISVKRIATFLLLDEMTDDKLNARSEKDTIISDENNENFESGFGNSSLEKSSSSHEDKIDSVPSEGDASESEISVGIRLKNVTAKWSEDLSENALTNVNLNVKPGQLVAVIGPVGSGKTSLIHAIMKELPVSSGSILVKGSVSYASQEPWLFTGSVRQNILFGQSMYRIRYKRVVKVCALERDFELLPYGDRTIVGDRGATLSGGQKARINLARAIYKEADIYLLDDPLSAVDTHVGRHLFDDCISDFLQGKIRILVTHQLQYLHTADNIVIFNNGEIQASGTYTALRESGVDFAKQLAAEAEASTKKISIPGIIQSVMYHQQSRQFSAMHMMSSVAVVEPHMVYEIRSQGGVSFKVYHAYCSAGGNCCVTFLLFGIFVLSQIAYSAGNYWMSFWSKVEERRNASETNMHSTSANEKQWLPNTETCVYIYTGILITIVLFDFSSVVLFYTICTRASVRLHNAMFASITRATMWFFNNNPSGQILNRFSKDMGSIDDFLPQTMMDCVLTSLNLLGMVTLVAIVNYWMLIPTAVMFVFFYFFRLYYLSTSRSIKRLEGITRSPVFSHLSASLQGLTTIRAFGAETLLEKEFDNHQDLHSSAWFMFLATSRAFALWLDSVCLVYIALINLSFLFVGKGQYGGDVGLAITQAVGMIGIIQWGMRQSGELENHMTSVERVLEYTNVESEPPLDSPDNKPEAAWPSQGIIEFDHASLCYSKDDPPVLKDVNFSTKPSEKVGVVGRTGAGKSSLFSALFRLVELSDGSVKIDGIDTASIGLHNLRSKISVIPQEPALFSGTLRYNLDPFDQYPDGALWAALAEVELKQVVEELPAGLSHKVSEGGSNFSVGQRQLLCLARAIIRNNKILVLDEATANVDPQTDELIQATVRNKFSDCTLLTIAHRINTVMDSDRILVMDAGSVAEFDHPYLLLGNKNGIFYQMVQQTGHAMADLLTKVAQTCYEKSLKMAAEK